MGVPEDVLCYGIASHSCHVSILSSETSGSAVRNDYSCYKIIICDNVHEHGRSLLSSILIVASISFIQALPSRLTYLSLLLISTSDLQARCSM